MEQPPKISAALEYLRYCDGVRNRSAHFDGARVEPRELAKNEQRSYDAALEVLRNYFSGELELDEAFYKAKQGTKD